MGHQSDGRFTSNIDEQSKKPEHHHYLRKQGRVSGICKNAGSILNHVIAS
jgi:hypothetical protein